MNFTDPAFPRITGLSVNTDESTAEVKGNAGITVFDYYAAQAMAAYIIALQATSSADFNKRSIPMHAFHVAKNMAEERKKYLDPATVE